MTQPVSYNRVKQSFEYAGYTLLSTEYINNKRKLSFICPQGHYHQITWNDFSKGHRCGRCKGNVIAGSLPSKARKK